MYKEGGGLLDYLRAIDSVSGINSYSNLSLKKISIISSFVNFEEEFRFFW